MNLSVADTLAGGGVCTNSVSCAATRRRVNFSARLEISACGLVGSYFPARIPLEGRSEGGAPVGVHFD